MVLNERPLPQSMPIKLDLVLFNNCSLVHIECTNLKRTFTIDSKIDETFEQVGQTCHVRAVLHVPTVPASFHIGIGDSYYGEDGQHQHLAYVLRDRNVSHLVNQITFGDVTGLESPMDNISVILTKPTAYMITYFVQLIPVRKRYRVGYQAVASLAKTNLEKIRTKGIAGIVFEWNFAPTALVVAKERKSVIELVCHVLAVFGYAFVFVRVADYIVGRLQIRTK